MKNKAKFSLFAISLILSGCGPGEFFEATTYDIPNSVWNQMSASERYRVEQSYRIQQEQKAEQQRIDAALAVQRANLERTRQERQSIENANRNAEYARQNAEHARIMRQSQELIHRNQINSQPRTIPQQPSEENQVMEEAKRRSMETYNQEQAARNAAANNATPNIWQPNEGQLVRGGQLVMDLQRELGRQPTAGEMQTHLQTHMGLSPEQANKTLDELGLT